MVRKQKRYRAGLAVGLLVALAGCATNPLRVTRTLCPAVAVVQSAGTLTKFASETAANAEGVVYTATVSGVQGTCAETKEQVTSRITYEVGATRPVATGALSVDAPLFVAIVRNGALPGEEMILSKQIYPVRLDFADGAYQARQTGVVQTSVSQSAARAAAKPTPKSFDETGVSEALPTASGFELLLGFQLSEREASYNIRR